MSVAVECVVRGASRAACMRGGEACGGVLYACARRIVREPHRRGGWRAYAGSAVKRQARLRSSYQRASRVLRSCLCARASPS